MIEKVKFFEKAFDQKAGKLKGLRTRVKRQRGVGMLLIQMERVKRWEFEFLLKQRQRIKTKNYSCG